MGPRPYTRPMDTEVSKTNLISAVMELFTQQQKQPSKSIIERASSCVVGIVQDTNRRVSRRARTGLSEGQRGCFTSSGQRRWGFSGALRSALALRFE